MEQTAVQFGKTLLYGISAALTMVLIATAFKSGGIIWNAAEAFMTSICG